MADDRYLASLLLDAYDFVWHRLLRRLDGITDAEYLWEPVEGCWTVRLLDDGTPYQEPPVWPEVVPSPFTTIAWRTCHIADNFLEARIGPIFGQPPFAGPWQVPLTALDGIAYMDNAYATWRRYLVSATDDQLASPLDQGTTPYEGQPLTRFVLQYLEELAHHAAEVALLRDLYRNSPHPSS